jgi:hypothetical protein
MYSEFRDCPFQIKRVAAVRWQCGKYARTPCKIQNQPAASQRYDESAAIWHQTSPYIGERFGENSVGGKWLIGCGVTHAVNVIGSRAGGGWGVKLFC